MANAWSVLIYMAADNNLSEECVYDLQEIQNVGAVEGLDVVALLDTSARGVKTKIYDFGGNRRGKAGADGALESLATPFSVTVKPDGGGAPRKVESSADPELLKGFLKTRIEKRPAERYLVVLSGHGSGAVGDFLKGDNPPGSLSIRDLAAALNAVKKMIKGGKIHVLGMDSCLMSMAEVCAELSGAVQFMVGAEGFELNTGWPYQRILEEWKAAGERKAPKDLEPEELARIIVKTYTRYYRDYVVAGVSVDQAACDLRNFGKVTSAVKTLAATLKQKVRDPEAQNAILLAHWRAQSYKNEQYVDLWDFCDLLEEGCNRRDVQTACKRVKEAVESVVLLSCYSGAAFQHSHGLSIFFPWRGDEKRVARNPGEKSDDLTAYKGLKFHAETKWGDFLDAYVEATRREMRGEHRGKSGARKTGGSKIKPVCIVPTDESRMDVREGPPINRGEGRGTGSMKNPPVCFIPAGCEEDGER
ncbi:MAG: clostripain-related cysteine peptidase [Blastocatellales bacterium]